MLYILGYLCVYSRRRSYSFHSCGLSSILHHYGSFLFLLTLGWHVIITQSPRLTPSITIAVTHSLGSEKYTMASIYHHSSTGNSFNPPRILWVSSIHTPKPYCLATADLLTFWEVSPFPECGRLKQMCYFFRLVSFIEWYALAFPLCLFKSW